ncbi:SDR family NAD(P)-dependent oxidoreductase [Siccirubricoccus sp. G192]|uniref:SDR family NAD(P)-dependent oxidoreductase n=1 Tax=Siccirubricoccus sp. G192 TaxID=2849651 RepID=UPI0020C50C46|nr:glucose 1-dehydrogenase [Siccirubricoccus sp. G192]
MDSITDDLEGKVAIVTGAGSRPGEGVGNGRAAAILFARAGARVVLADANAEWAEETQRMIAAEDGESLVVQADVTRPEDCRKIVRAAVEAYGRLDILLNNVGVSGPPGTAEEVDLEAWSHGLLVNVTSMMLMAKYAVPEMRRAGGGAIVNIGSVAGLRGGHPGLLYPTSKGAVVNMTRAMAVHHAKDRIRVNCICPGMVYTPMVQAKGMTPEMREARRKRSILQVEGSGWDVGAAVVFLASGKARWMTGAIVPVDAGATAIAALSSGAG